MSYRNFLPWQSLPYLKGESPEPDERTGRVYLHNPTLQLAAEAAIVTQRPLLLTGNPGCGKSSFAPFVARNLNWRYYELTVTRRTEAQDLLWRFDALARLRDAQAGRTGDAGVAASRYIIPGPLWWAFNRASAAAIISMHTALADTSAISSHQLEPSGLINKERDPEGAVVLIDEIDKADPDVPNDLLEVLSVHRFHVNELGQTVERQNPQRHNSETLARQFGGLLVVITSNRERDLPSAFVRRCVVLNLTEPSEVSELTKRLLDVANLHLNSMIKSAPKGVSIARQIATKCATLRLNEGGENGSPSTAEYLDALRIALQLGIDPNGELWSDIESCALIKFGASF